MALGDREDRRAKGSELTHEQHDHNHMLSESDSGAVFPATELFVGRRFRLISHATLPDGVYFYNALLAWQQSELY